MLVFVRRDTVGRLCGDDRVARKPALPSLLFRLAADRGDGGAALPGPPERSLERQGAWRCPRLA